MVGVATLLEGLLVIPPNVLTLVAATKTDVLPDRSSDGHQWTYRAIQNKTGADLYIAVNIDCDNAANYHFVISDGAQFNVPCLGRVSCYSVGGGKVLTYEQRRIRGT